MVLITAHPLVTAPSPTAVGAAYSIQPEVRPFISQLSVRGSCKLEVDQAFSAEELAVFRFRALWLRNKAVRQNVWCAFSSAVPREPPRGTASPRPTPHGGPWPSAAAGCQI